MNIKELESTARALVSEGKGLLAADESFGAIEKRFKNGAPSRTRRTAALTARCSSPRPEQE